MIAVSIHPDCYTIRVDDDTCVIVDTAQELDEILAYAPEDQTVTYQFAGPFVNPKEF
jgi:hypothetical protein